MSQFRKGVGVPVDDTLRRFAVPGVNSDAPLTPEQERGRYSRKRIRRLSLTLDSSRDDVLFDYSGTAFWVSNGSSDAAEIEVRLDDEANDPITLNPGAFIQGVPFKEFRITNASQAGESVEIIIITDKPNDFVTFDS